MTKKIVFSIEGKDIIVSQIDYAKLHTFIVKKVSSELAALVDDCYYPTISTIYKDLLHMTNSDEKTLLSYSEKKYGRPKYKLLHDPQTTLLIIIVQEFLKVHDVAAALSAFHLFSLRMYSNLLHRYIKYCNGEYFKTALGMLSHNHLFVLKQTIPSSIVYLSNTLFKKYQQDLVQDNPDALVLLVYEIRTRFNQSVKSFAKKYYQVHQNKTSIKSEEEKEYDTGFETKLRQFVDTISKNITVYKQIDQNALDEAKNLTKFNKSLSQKYAQTMCNLKYTKDVNDALYIFLRNIGDFSKVSTAQILDYTKKLMSIKVSKQPEYFKKTITKIHDQVIKDLRITEWFDGLSIQSKAISRNFIAYYLTLYMKNHIS